METYEYQTLYDLEDTYWWFRGLRAVLGSQIEKFKPARVEKALDAGCGTGRNLLLLSEKLKAPCFGIDLSEDAVRFCKKRGLDNVQTGSVNQIPFPDSNFDFVISIDVLECDEVNESKAIHEIARVLSNSGVAIITATACKWLYSKEHDAAVHASRRYSEAEFRNLLENHGLEIVRITHLFPFFFPFIALYRLLERSKPASKVPKSNIKKLPGFFNTFLTWLSHWDAFLVSRFDFAWGSSLLAVVTKRGN